MVAAKIRAEHAGQNTKIPIPSKLIHAIIAAEDRRFWRHRGVDFLSIIRAVWRYLQRGTISGASTIEQQLVRTLRQRYELSLSRKLSEMYIATAISRQFEKMVLAEVYCRVAYLGWQARGVEQAARRLGVNLTSLSDKEAATIAAMLKLPMPKYPSARYRTRLGERVDYVLRWMKSREAKND